MGSGGACSNRSAVHGIILFKNTSEFHKKEEEEKERLQKAVQEADAESKAKTDFMNRISHDIRTPINGIMGMLEILRKNAHNPEKMEECMDKMQVSADHLLALVNDVLDMNKLETDQIQEENEPFDLEVLMREVAVLMNPILEQNQITHRVHRKNIQHTALSNTLTIDKSIATKVTQDVKEEDGYKTITTTYAYDGYNFQLEAEADAVQTHNAQDAIKSAWGVDVDVDGNGNISLR